MNTAATWGCYQFSIYGSGGIYGRRRSRSTGVSRINTCTLRRHLIEQYTDHAPLPCADHLIPACWRRPMFVWPTSCPQNPAVALCRVTTVGVDMLMIRRIIVAEALVLSFEKNCNIYQLTILLPVRADPWWC
jgi:hypothetical protein